MTFEVTKDMLSFYDPEKKDWVFEPGAFTFHVGAASDDIRSTANLTL